ncbi:peptidase [Paenirhodobacter sp.]|uniref:peptidase n=1 Tax=Paenirhodobacter sp. TaxID=1965326 RepID=UPI003B40229C
MSETSTGLRAVGIARGWIGTPYVHQASVQGAGTDCLGLLRGIWRALYRHEPESVPPYTPDWAEPSREERLWAAARRHLLPLSEVVGSPPDGPGEVLLFRLRQGAVAKHLGISAMGGSGPSFIHAYTGHGVIESPLSQPWQRRIVARFAFPEGAV